MTKKPGIAEKKTKSKKPKDQVGQKGRGGQNVETG